MHQHIFYLSASEAGFEATGAQNDAFQGAPPRLVGLLNNDYDQNLYDQIADFDYPLNPFGNQDTNQGRYNLV